MGLTKVCKVVIITEHLIQDRVTRLIEQNGASGYTLVEAGGKGSRNVRSSTTAALVADFTNVKIEVVVANHDAAEALMNEVTEKLFKDYSGITYAQEVEVLRRTKFNIAPEA